MNKLYLSFFAATALAQKCSDLTTEDYLAEGKDRVYTSEFGYYRGRETYYWEFGDRSTPAGPADNPGAKVATAPIWVMQTEDGKQVGKNIIDVLPCEDNYSDLWEVRIVTVGADYEADTYTSAAMVTAAVDAGEASVAPADPPTWVNCPVVPLGSTLVDASPGADDVDTDLLVEGWYQEQPVVYFDFGQVTTQDTEPVWVLTTADADAPGGIQANLIDTVPGGESDQEPYTPFWQMVVVTVPDEFAATAADEPVTSAADIQSNDDFVEEPQPAIVNCPVSWTADQTIEDGGDDDDDDGDDQDGDDDDGAEPAGGASSLAISALSGVLLAAMA